MSFINFFIAILCYNLSFYDVLRSSVCYRCYYVRHKAETPENRRFFSIGMEFAENAYAYVLKAPSRS